MIELVDLNKKSKKKKEPYYKLVYNYMIGDADGYTKEDVDISKDNPYVERYIRLLNSLKPTKGSWGLQLESEDIEKCLKEKQINEEDFKFLMRTMFEDALSDDKRFTEEDMDWENEHKNEFFDGVRSEAEYSFLVFQGCELFYYDEYGVKFGTKFV